MSLSASLVLYNNPPTQFEAAIASFISGSQDGMLCVVDNSEQPLSSLWFGHDRVHYVHADKNLGFGAGHNLAMSKVCPHSDLHLLLNPDIEFDAGLLPTLAAMMNAQPEVAALMPRIVYPDGSLQHLCKLLPTPMDLLVRRFLPSRTLKERLNRRYELHHLPLDRPSAVPTLSGCLLLARSPDLLRLGGFDERYFMYMEDVDLVRRLGDLGQTLYTPQVQAVHGYAKGSYRSKKLMGYHLRSAILYFNKWGWFFDPVRTRRNRVAMQAGPVG
ncbi:MAG: glycosyltransferase family 2 protein [Burkholderiaceae bacterium]|nr:glycosyltransferase family 2 protein [Burkholderiaceae bacterium]